MKILSAGVPIPRERQYLVGTCPFCKTVFVFNRLTEATVMEPVNGTKFFQLICPHCTWVMVLDNKKCRKPTEEEMEGIP